MSDLINMRVFRVEHMTDKHDSSKHFLGPFGHNSCMFAYACNTLLDDDPYSHPIPSNDGISLRWFEGNRVCAVQTLDMVAEWFECPLGRRAMASLGFHVVEYQASVNAAHIGDMQVVFDPSLAEPVSTYHLETLQKFTNC